MTKDSDKKKLIAMTLGMIMVIAGTLVFYSVARQQSAFDAQEWIFLGLVLFILIFSGILFLRRFKDVKKGLPVEDERSKQVLNMASSRSFYVSMYWLLAISIFEKQFADLFGVEQLDPGQVVGGGILGMTVAFIGFWLYYNSKGNVE